MTAKTNLRAKYKIYNVTFNESEKKVHRECPFCIAPNTYLQISLDI